MQNFLIKDLHDMDPRGRFPFFLQFFLSERKFLVGVGTSLSDFYNQEMRVPQYFLKIFKNILENWSFLLLIHIVKPGKDSKEPKNYRPIVLTSYVCKTMERMINVRVAWFLESFSHIMEAQSGFQENKNHNRSPCAF